MKARAIIMCKAPIPGRVKTRMMPEFSPDAAAALHRAMAEATLAKVKRVFPEVWLAADDPAHPFFADISLPVKAQGEGSLGDRMRRLMRAHFADAEAPVVFVGCDSPHMPEMRLHEALHALADRDAVLGPVEDGGYDVLGLRRPVSAVFSAIDWGSSVVLRQTIARLERAACSYRLLSVHYDLDTVEDLKRSRWRPEHASALPFLPL